MALLGDNINSITRTIHFGSRGDICILCRRKLAEQSPHMSLGAIDRELLGKLEGKKAFKTRHSGADIVICMDHIKELAAEDTATTSDSQVKSGAKEEQ